MNRITQPLSRRTFLRGVGVTMALPWLESVPVWGDEKPKNSARSRRCGSPCLFSGNGFHSKEWWAKGEGTEMELGKVLAPLRPLPREDAVHPRPLQRRGPHGGTSTARRPATCSPARTLASGGEIRSGTSFDQVARAAATADQTKVPSLVLGCETSIASVHKNYSMLYSSHISWSSPTTPTPLELYPALAFDRLFRTRSARPTRACSTPCSTTPRDFRRNVSTSDQRKLDEYLDSVREVEQRIEQAGKAGRAAGLAADARQARTCPRPADGIPQDIDRAHAADVRHPRARPSRPTRRASARSS